MTTEEHGEVEHTYEVDLGAEVDLLDPSVLRGICLSAPPIEVDQTGSSVDDPDPRFCPAQVTLRRLEHGDADVLADLPGKGPGVWLRL